MMTHSASRPSQRRSSALAERTSPRRVERGHEPGAAAPAARYALYRGNRGDFQAAREVSRAAISREPSENGGGDRRRQAPALLKYYIDHIADDACCKDTLSCKMTDRTIRFAPTQRYVCPRRPPDSLVWRGVLRAYPATPRRNVSDGATSLVVAISKAPRPPIQRPLLFAR